MSTTGFLGRAPAHATRAEFENCSKGSRTNNLIKFEITHLLRNLYLHLNFEDSTCHVLLISKTAQVLLQVL